MIPIAAQFLHKLVCGRSVATRAGPSRSHAPSMNRIRRTAADESQQMNREVKREGEKQSEPRQGLPGEARKVGDNLLSR